MPKEIVVVGPGHLAHAVVSRWLKVADVKIQVLARSERYLAKGWTPEEESLVTFRADALRRAKLVVLAVKPKDMADTLATLEEFIPPKALVLSFAAGISIEQIHNAWPHHGIVRTMPNICSEIGCSVTGAAFSDVSAAEKAWVMELLNLLGYVTEMPEHLLNPMTALYGSGPAYVYIFIQSIMQAAADLGIPDGQSRELAAQMVKGASEMALNDRQKSLAQLVDEVVSPGGTTEAMLKVLVQSGWQDILHQALKAAGERAIQLGQAPSPA